MNQINLQIKTTHASIPDVFISSYKHQDALYQSEKKYSRNIISQSTLFRFPSFNGKCYTNTVLLRVDSVDNDSNRILINSKFIVQQTETIPLLVYNSVEVIFREYYSKWYNKTKYLSSPKMFENKHYKEIISLGISVVPSIIKKLKEEPVHLFEALVKITGQDPVPESHWGDAEQMARDWISWWENDQHVQK